MPFVVNEDHHALAEVVRQFLTDQDSARLTRQIIDSEDRATQRPFWKSVREMGWLGLHLPEDVGGEGFGLAESTVIAYEMAKAIAPGPFLPAVIASATLDRTGEAEQRAVWLPQLATGELTAATAWIGSLRMDGSALTGVAPAVLGAADADLLLLPVGDDLAVVRATAPGVRVEVPGQVDPTRATGVVHCQEAAVSAVLPGARPLAERIARILAAAEGAGVAAGCVEQAGAYAMVREQFGRTIATFQAIKHHCADMLVEAELAAAAAWGAARLAQDDQHADHSAVVAVVQALPAAVRCAETNIQVHGGIGFTWEHDAHLYYKRALALSTLFEADTTAAGRLSELTRAGRRQPVKVAMDQAEADQYRAEIWKLRERLGRLSEEERRVHLVDEGYLFPHYPRPYGRGAGPVEQLVIEEELGDIPRPDLGIGEWIVPTIIQCGTPGQLDRWVRPTLLGEIRFCQLFSEPGAGSDASAISTKARRVEGGWRVTGQKVWTTDAAYCNRGLATVRTDPSAPKRAGVSAMVLDLKADGVVVRPLRDITGEALFNEVFLDDVFVPDEDVLGEVGAGWKVVRATIGNERVSIGADTGGTTFSAHDLARLEGTARADVFTIGRLVAEHDAMALLGLQHVERTIAGETIGAEGNITKLLSAEHAQRVMRSAAEALGTAFAAGSRRDVYAELLYARGLTIGGGTSEMSRNQIAEQLLGFPRDPLTS
ncbi:acyl-CoA dehydrogenase [Streptomyces sp. NPDC096311]|uniref:acyl-CoA dehydrogenase n=1 Tax=Streptomyces sp. NPDC096311 TaxID=3366083 RepID=UPI0038206976